MPTYAIEGITGQVGRAAAEQLLADGAGIRAVVRSEANGAIWRERGAEVAIATLDVAAALQAAFEGVDGVFVMTPTWFEAQDMFAENAKAFRRLIFFYQSYIGDQRENPHRSQLMLPYTGYRS